LIQIKLKFIDMSDLYLLNDDHNDIKKVIDNLMVITRHNVLQANQCATLAHYNGRAHIKKGDIMDLLEMKAEFSEKDILTEIE
jgi:ATP-dependent Clp protease adaptor protein ClpS